MPPIISSSVSRSSATTRDSEDDLIQSDILRQEADLPQKVSSTGKKRKSTSTSTKLSNAKQRRRDYLIPARSRSMFRDSPTLAQDAQAQEIGLETSDNGSFQSSPKRRTEEERLKEKSMELRIFNSLENRIGDIVEDRLSKILKNRSKSNTVGHSNNHPRRERSSSSQRKNMVEDARNEESDIYGVSESPPPVLRGARPARKVQLLMSTDGGADEVARGSRSDSSFSPLDLPQQSVLRRQNTAESGQLDVQDLHSSISSLENIDPNQEQPEAPMFIKRLPVLENAFVPGNPTKFSKKQIMSLLGGTKFAKTNHLYTVKKTRPGLTRKIKGYYIIDPPQPFAPSRPGQHGALVASYMLQWENISEELYKGDLPLFVNDGKGLYTYFGQYVEPRYSDTISFNEMASVIPDSLKQYHAKELCDKKDGHKPKVAIMALKNQWPTTPVGWWNQQTQSMDPWTVEEEYERGMPCQVPITDEQAEEITYEEVLEAFERPDFDDNPSFRLFWEYLKCVGYDREFYKSLKSQLKRQNGMRREM